MTDPAPSSGFDRDEILDDDPDLEVLHDREYRVRAFRNDPNILIRGAVRDQKPANLYFADDPNPLTIHHMQVDLEVAFPTLEIVGVTVHFEMHPNDSCPSITQHYESLIGLSIARGFTHRVRELFGGPRGCTHTTALLQAMAPVAVQCFWSMTASDSRRNAGNVEFRSTPMSRAQRDGMWKMNVNTCHVWAEDGDMVASVKAGQPGPPPLFAQQRLAELGLTEEDWRSGMRGSLTPVGSDVGSGLVGLQVEGGIAVITLNRPDKRNALNGVMIAALGDAYRACDLDAEVRVVVLTGAGSAFCAGADLSPGSAAFGAITDPDSFQSSPVRPRAWEVRKPVIAAINGAAIGIGLSIALQTDLRIVATDATLAVLQTRRGVVPDGQSHFVLPRLVGVARAAELLIAGRGISGARAAEWGLANEAVAAVDVLPTAMEWARDIAVSVSPLSAATSKRIMWRGLASTADEVDILEREAHLALMGRPDAVEGGRSFAERRVPEWSSRVPDDWPFPA